MRILLSILVVMSALYGLVGGSSAYAQTAGLPGGLPTGDQWVSHQMNQPPPSATDKNALSPDAVDDIKQLYQQAKKEHEAKTVGASKDSKNPAPPKPGKSKGK